MVLVKRSCNAPILVSWVLVTSKVSLTRAEKKRKSTQQSFLVTIADNRTLAKSINNYLKIH